MFCKDINFIFGCCFKETGYGDGRTHEEGFAEREEDSYSLLGLVLGIVVWVMANEKRKLFMDAPEDYTVASLRRVNVGRLCGVIAACVGIVALVTGILLRDVS